MAKKRRKIAEVVSTEENKASVTPKTKEKYVFDSALEQENFNKRNAASFVSSEKYDKASKLEPGAGQKSIPEHTNYTARDARKMDPVYADASGLGINQMMRRKDAGTPVYATKDQPTLYNPNGKGLDENKKNTENDLTAYSFPEGAVDESGFGQPKDSMEQVQAYTFPKEEGDDSGFGKAKDTSKTLPMEKINAYSFSEQPVDESAFDPIKTGETLVNAMATDATNTVADKAILAQIQNAESPEEIAKIKADAEAAKIEEQKQKEQLANQNSALLNTIHEINHGQQGQRDSFDKIATIEDVQRGVLDQYRNQASNVPYAVVEKLGIQDYYPNAGRDIAVGTFSGSRIGSQTIYSGAGALLPMGLYDARKRSLVEAAKAVQKKKDEFLQVPNAPQQFNADFQQAAYSELYDIGAKHGWNMNAIMKDKEAMQRVYGIKNAAKDLAYTDEIVNNIFETINTADGKTASYVPEDILQKMIEYRQGKLDVDAILSGENNVLELAGEIRNYANGTAWADKNLAEWKSDPVSLPLNLKTDKEITMDNLNEINQSIEKAKVSGSYDSYITAVKKYFHLDPKVVDAWVEQNMVGATPDQKQKVVDDLNTYILAQMPPESIEEKIENLKNDNYNYWAKSQDLARYDKERETIMTRAINEANKSKLKDRISAINNDTSLNSPEKKAAALSKAYRDAGFTPNYNKKTGEVYGVVKYTAADKKMNVVYPSNTTQVWVQKSQKAGGGMAWVNISTVLANQGNYKLTSDQKTELTEFQKGGARGSINESRMYETYVDDNGYTRKVGTNNLDKYSKTTREKKGIGTETVGNVVIASADKDGNVTYKPGTMQIRAQFNPETNPTDRDALDAMFSDEKQKLSTDPTFNAGGPSSNF
jgi:hypothetical protein